MSNFEVAPTKSKARKKRYVLSAFLCFLALELFVVRDWSYTIENLGSSRFLVNLAVSFLGFAIALWGFVTFVPQRRTFRFALYLLFLVPVILQANHFAVYRELIGAFGFSFFRDNPSLTLNYFSENVSLVKSVIAALLLALGFGFFLVGSSPTRKLKPRYGFLLAGTSSAVVLSILGVCTYSWYGVHEYQQSVVAFASSLLEYSSRKGGLFQVQRKQLHAIPTAPVRARQIVWVIGESTVLSRMGIFGYPRDTTPQLQKLKEHRKVIAFNNAVSIGTRTMLSVPYMMFGLEGPDPKGRIYKYPTVFNYAKSRGYKTALISAQDMSWYNIDKLLVDEDVDVFKPGTRFSSNVTVSKGADDGIVLQKGVVPFLESADEKFLLVLQMDGSHYPYSEHSPSEFKKFLPEESPNCSNAYDNTIVYTDAILSQLEREVHKRFPDAWIFFSPDHGQNLGTYKKFVSGFDLDIIHNGLLIFPPTRDEKTFSQLAAHVSAPLSQTDIFATILDLIGAEPEKPINGYSLLRTIPADRVRVTSTFMPTFNNDPMAVIVTPKLDVLEVDLNKETVKSEEGKLTRLSELGENLRRAVLKE